MLQHDHAVGLAHTFADRVPVDAGPVQRAQIDDLGIDVHLVGHLNSQWRHGEIGQNREPHARAHHLGFTQRDEVVKIFQRSLAGRVVQARVFDHQHRILAQQGAVHEAHIVERR